MSHSLSDVPDLAPILHYELCQVVSRKKKQAPGQQVHRTEPEDHRRAWLGLTR